MKRLPILIVSVGLLAWQLVVRRHEAIAAEAAPEITGGRLQEQS